MFLMVLIALVAQQPLASIEGVVIKVRSKSSSEPTPERLKGLSSMRDSRRLLIEPWRWSPISVFVRGPIYIRSCRQTMQAISECKA
jgi:hypothetical protein